MLDLKKLSSYYTAHNSGLQLNGKPALFIRPTKEESAKFFLPLVNEASDIIAIPMHNFVSLGDSHRSFLCRRFMAAEDPKIACPLCEDGLKAYRKYYLTGLLYEGENARKLAPAKDAEGFYKIGIVDLSKALATSLEAIKAMNGGYMTQTLGYLRSADQDGHVTYSLQKAKELECKEVDGIALPALDWQKMAESADHYAGLEDFVLEETKETVYKLYTDSKEAEEEKK